MANVFKKYHARIVREGVLKALFCGLIVGCSVLLVTAALSWFFGFKPGLWLGLALFVICTAGSMPIFYFKKFRPTTKAIAMRVDELGLEERLLTMTELENDDSYIAMRQREDALTALKGVDHLLVKIVVSAALIVSLAVVGVFGLGMFTVEVLNYAGVIPSAVELLRGEHIPKNYTLSYKVGEGEGKIVYYTDDWRDEEIVWDSAWTEEEIEEKDYEFTHLQTVKEGKDGRLVVAEPSEGYVFLAWSDGVLDPYRQDFSVKHSIKVKAIFAEIDPGAEDEMLQQEMSFKPSEEKEGNGGKSDVPPPPQQQQQQKPGPNDDPNNGGGAGDGGSANENIRDGSTFYGDLYEDAQQNGMDRLNQESGRTDAEKGDVNDYYEGIKKGKSEKGN